MRRTCKPSRLPVICLFLACCTLLPASALGQNSGARPDQHVVMITGSTAGLGREVAVRVAATGAHVIVHGRNEERGAGVVAAIDSAGVGSATFYRADLASLDEVEDLAERVLRDFERLDILINNAGILSLSGPRRLSHDGYELGFAVNYLAGFVLTRRLLPLLTASAPARIIHVSSLAQQPLEFGNLMLEQGYSGSRSYGQSKLAQVMFTNDLADELEGSGVTAVSLHPASMMDTGMVRNAGMQPRTSVDEGATAVMNLVTGQIENGRYYNGLAPSRAHDQAYDVDARTKLRIESLRLVADR